MDNKNTLTVNNEQVATRPLTNQPAPTTSTVGYRGQVIFDVDGNGWKCLNTPMTTWNQTANYIWALADRYNFPLANTEYVSHYDYRPAKIVYKRFVTGTLASALNTSISIAGMAYVLFDLSGGSIKTSNQNQVSIGGNSTATVCSGVQHSPIGTLLLQVGSALYGLNYEYSLFYTK